MKRRAALLAVLVPILSTSAASAGTYHPLVDGGFDPLTADDADLVVVRERFDEARQQQSIYVRLAGKATTCHAVLVVAGASVVDVLHGHDQLLASDAAWGLPAADYSAGGDPASRGLEGSPRQARPTQLSPRDALRWTAGGTLVRLFLQTSSEQDIDDLRILLRYPDNPGNAWFDLLLYQAGDAPPPADELWPPGALAGIRVGSTVADHAPDDGEYVEAARQISGIHLLLEDLDILESTLRFGFVEPGRPYTLPLTLDNSFAGEDPDGDNDSDMNGLLSPILGTNDLVALSTRVDPLTSGGGASVIPVESISFPTPPPRQLPIGTQAQVDLTIITPRNQPSGAYRGSILFFEDNNDNGLLDPYEIWDRLWISITVIQGPGEGEGEGEGEPDGGAGADGGVGGD
ncbi:MAG: hypothetical protein FJ125_16260, partial [Deltaproteobacteria bacterium]|nr:hypothetical protein [Deltaproteobacteria bacterium]